MRHPYDGKNQGLTSSELDCKKIKWMVDNSPEWDYENTSLEDYLETLPDYPTDEQVEGYNHLFVGAIANPKKKELVPNE